MFQAPARERTRVTCTELNRVGEGREEQVFAHVKAGRGASLRRDGHDEGRRVDELQGGHHHRVVAGFAAVFLPCGCTGGRGILLASWGVAEI